MDVDKTVWHAGWSWRWQNNKTSIILVSKDAQILGLGCWVGPQSRSSGGGATQVSANIGPACHPEDLETVLWRKKNARTSTDFSLGTEADIIRIALQETNNSARRLFPCCQGRARKQQTEWTTAFFPWIWEVVGSRITFTCRTLVVAWNYSLELPTAIVFNILDVYTCLCGFSLPVCEWMRERDVLLKWKKV